MALFIMGDRESQYKQVIIIDTLIITREVVSSDKIMIIFATLVFRYIRCNVTSIVTNNASRVRIRPNLAGISRFLIHSSHIELRIEAGRFFRDFMRFLNFYPVSYKCKKINFKN